MTYLATTGTAGVIDINGTVIVEILTFLIMLAILARYVYPEVVKIAEARQRAIAEELATAEKARADAEARLQEANAKLADARRTADTVVEGANRSGEQLRQELREKAEAEYQRVVEGAQKDIEAERERALESARAEVAGMVVVATRKVIGETLDERRHHKLIEDAIEEVASGNGRG
jgi:F-type H+-transporting ATPase subunit b